MPQTVTTTQEPLHNELIMCKPFGKVKYLGHGLIEIQNKKIEKLEGPWKPLKKWKHVFQVLHHDGIARIEAEGKVVNDEIKIEYKFRGMHYCRVQPKEKTGF